MKRIVLLPLFTFHFVCHSQPWIPDLGNGKYKNPVIWADYSDPDVCRVGKDFYMTASSFHCVPALPILHSTDLVNWEIINYAVKRFPDSHFDVVQHGNGVWAPSIRFHDGWFHIYWGDPDRGILMVRSQDPRGDWEAPVLVKKAHGNIDPCPLWDDDGKVYLVHAFANSRAGVSHILQLQELNADGSEANSAVRNIIINGWPENATLEGPKFYKRNGYYYIFAPAGGVPTGWQMVYRSKNIWGPYEGKRVLEQGDTKVNGPHQGGWVELENGQNWFVHFQELQPYGRIVHLQPVVWKDGWPVMGIDKDGDGCGFPVMENDKPKTGKSEVKVPVTSDEFNGESCNLAWQWQANFHDHWYSFSANPGHLRLHARYHPFSGSIFLAPNILAQKLPAPTFTATVRINVANLKNSEKAGLVMMGQDYAALEVRKGGEGNQIRFAICNNAYHGFTEQLDGMAISESNELLLRVVLKEGGRCRFAYSADGKQFIDIGKEFQAREGRWVGAKVGIYAISSQETGIKGYADFDWFRIE